MSVFCLMQLASHLVNVLVSKVDELLSIANQQKRKGTTGKMLNS